MPRINKPSAKPSTKPLVIAVAVIAAAGALAAAGSYYSRRPASPSQSPASATVQPAPPLPFNEPAAPVVTAPVAPPSRSLTGAVQKIKGTTLTVTVDQAFLDQAPAGAPKTRTVTVAKDTVIALIGAVTTAETPTPTIRDIKVGSRISVTAADDIAMSASFTAKTIDVYSGSAQTEAPPPPTAAGATAPSAPSSVPPPTVQP